MEITDTSEAPELFRELIEKLQFEEDNTSLANDAHGLPEFGHFDNIGVASPHLTKETALSALECLDYYEKVSLAFLLCDDVNYILQRMMTAELARLAGSLIPVDILSEFLRLQRSGTWENKLVEALCIIQNYQMLEKLGYNIEFTKERFVPSSPETSLFVNCMRKALYRLCEDLPAERLDELLKRVRIDYERLNHGQPWQEFDVELMEINILYWSLHAYINLGDRNGRGVEIKRLKAILKAMDEMVILDRLESAERATVNASVGYRIDMISSSDSSSTITSCRSSEPSTPSQSSSITSQHSVASTCIPTHGQQQLEKYAVNPSNVGICLIINQKRFHEDLAYKSMLPDEKLPTRLGTDEDRERLVETFKAMGFITSTREDLKHDEILDTVEETLNDFKQEMSCFVLCIMSHGQQGQVYGSDSVPVYENQLEHLMKCRKLHGKPKILIIQACQGKAQQDALPHDSNDLALDGPDYRGLDADFLTFWSSVPGYASFRHELVGSWFVQALCDFFLRKRTTNDILKLFTLVNRKVGKQVVRLRGEIKTMVSRFQTSMMNDLELPLQQSKMLEVANLMFQRHLFNALFKEYSDSRTQKTRRRMEFEKIEGFHRPVIPRLSRQQYKY